MDFNEVRAKEKKHGMLLYAAYGNEYLHMTSGHFVKMDQLNDPNIKQMLETIAASHSCWQDARDKFHLTKHSGDKGFPTT